MTFIRKTKFGLSAFDNEFSGIYFNRATLLCGRKGSGKSTMAMRFVAKTLASGERLLLFSDGRPDDILLDAHAVDAELGPYLQSEQLLLVPYPPGVDFLDFPGALKELENMVTERHVPFVVFDTFAPWVSKRPASEMEAHVDQLNAAFTEMGLTTLLTLPWAKSPAAKAARRKLEELCPVVLEMDHGEDGARCMRVLKYHGETSIPLPLDFAVEETAAQVQVSVLDERGKTTKLSVPPEVKAAAERNAQGGATVRRRVLFSTGLADMGAAIPGGFGAAKVAGGEKRSGAKGDGGGKKKVLFSSAIADFGATAAAEAEKKAEARNESKVGVENPWQRIYSAQQTGEMPPAPAKAEDCGKGKSGKGGGGIRFSSIIK